MTVKTHTFNGAKHKIAFCDSIEGVTDNSEKVTDKNREMLILSGEDFRAFHSAFHESLEGSGFCDKCLHDKEGYPMTVDAARFLWRLGYRRVK